MATYKSRKRARASSYFVASVGWLGGFALGITNFSLGHAEAATTNAPATATNAPANPQSDPAPDLPTAILLYQQGKHDEALTALNSILQKAPQNIDALLLRGAIYTLKQQWDAAAKDYQAVLQLDDTSREARFDLADLKFRQHQFDDARTAFLALPESKDDDAQDLTQYKIFLCDLLAGHDDVAAKELAAFNQLAAKPSYYFGNAAWDLVHKKPEDARPWLVSAANIYPYKKHLLYMSILKEMGYLPLPPIPGT
jgi:tetratricopeptide (TPR) repeat protein